MLTYRTFQNSDPPMLASLWQSRYGQAGTSVSVSPDLFEQLVFAKLYFDYAGLSVALDDGRPVGFAHAGFGPNAQRDWISTESGVICAAAVAPGVPEREITGGLLNCCEEYLRGRGAKTIYGGGLRPMDPWYVGLYGSSDLPGILDSDAALREAFASAGYQEIERLTLMSRNLSGFESLIDRRQMQIRRQMVVEVTADAPTQDWWEATTVGEFDLTRFELVPRVGGPAAATACFRSMEPSGTATVARAAGLLDIAVHESYRRRGLAIFLLSEAFRQFIRQGVMQVEIQARQSNAAALGLFQKLGFKETASGGVWRKDV